MHWVREFYHPEAVIVAPRFHGQALVRADAVHEPADV